MFGGLGLGFALTLTSVRVNSFRESFSVLLRAQHYFRLTVRHRKYSLILLFSVNYKKRFDRIRWQYDI